MTTLGLLPDMLDLGPAIERASGQRYLWTPTVLGADVVLAGRSDPDAVAALVRHVAPVPVVLLDRDQDLRPEEVSSYLSTGIWTLVSGTSLLVLISHLDAVLRRRVWSSAPLSAPDPIGASSCALAL